MDLNEPICCTQDLKVKAEHGNYYSLDVESGNPVNVYDASKTYNSVLVRGFAGRLHKFPLSWFYQEFPSKEYEEAYHAYKKSKSRDKKAFIDGYLTALKINQ
jgi:hypothetical protein